MAADSRPAFFLPYVEDPAKADEFWHAGKAFMNDHGWDRVTDRRIFRLDYVHDGKRMEAEVGRPHVYGHPYTWEYVPDHDDPKAGEYVVAIYENEGGPFLVCTHNRGFVRGEPILVGSGEPMEIVYFEGHGPGESAGS
jgi:hypothetical protein